MEFGMFYEFPIREGHTQAEAFSEGFELVDDAEQQGLHAHQDGVQLCVRERIKRRKKTAAPVVGRHEAAPARRRRR